MKPEEEEEEEEEKKEEEEEEEEEEGEGEKRNKHVNREVKYYHLLSIGERPSVEFLLSLDSSILP